MSFVQLRRATKTISVTTTNATTAVHKTGVTTNGSAKSSFQLLSTIAEGGDIVADGSDKAQR